LSWCSDHYKQCTVKCTINTISVYKNMTQW
jgi:hypothetical protein